MRVSKISDLPKHVQAQIKDKESNGVEKTATDQTIFVDQLPPGLNGDHGLMRMHWNSYRELRDTWTMLIRAENPEKHEGRVNMEVSFCDRFDAYNQAKAWSELELNPNTNE